VAIALGASIPVSTALDGLLFVLVLAAWAASGALREKLAALRANPAALAALAFLGLLIVGIAWSSSAREGWYYVGKHRDLVLVAVLGGFLFTAREKQLALSAFLAAMTLSLALSYAIWLGFSPFDGKYTRTADNPTVFKLHITHGILMSLAAFLAGIRALRETRPRWRIAYGAGAFLAAFNVLFMVQGRTGYIVLAALLFYFCAAHWRWRGVALAALAGVAVIGAGYLAQAPLFGRSATAATEWQQWNAAGGHSTSTAIRMNYYKTTLAIIRDAPLIGVGTGGFVGAYRDKVRGTDLPESNNPHSQYLLTAAQLGVAGLAALLAMFALMWRQAARLEPQAALAARGLVLAIAVGSLLNSLLIDHAEGLLFAWMAGVLFAPERAPGRAPGRAG
jgi:O-antigen ligase